MKKYRIIKYMTGYAVQRRVFVFFWETIKVGQYWPIPDGRLIDKVMQFEIKRDAWNYLTKVLWINAKDVE